MAEAYLYSTRAENATKREGEVVTQLGVRDSVANAFESLKKTNKVKDEASVKVKFDQDKGAYQLLTEGMSAAQEKKLMASLERFTSPEAEQRWAADREAKSNEVETSRGAARQVAEKSGGAKAKRDQMVDKGEMSPTDAAAASREGAIKVYPALSQKNDYRKLVVETGSDSKYFGKPADQAHYSLITSVPERFAQYTGPEAQAQFAREFAEKNAGKAHSDVEVARAAATSRSGASFMAQFKDRGFLLADATRGKEMHEKGLSAMRSATSEQIETVIKVSSRLLAPLNQKEIQLRADAAGIPADEMGKKSFAEQRELSRGADGKSPSLQGEDRQKQQALARGLTAMRAELDARGEGRDMSQSRENGKDAGEQKQEGERKAPQSMSKGIDEEQSVDNALDMLQTSRRNRSGAGR